MPSEAGLGFRVYVQILLGCPRNDFSILLPPALCTVIADGLVHPKIVHLLAFTLLLYHCILL